MSNRYRAALSKGRQAYEQAIDEDKELLQEFGLMLLSTENGGIRAAMESELRGKDKIDPWNVIELSMKAWNWLRPLLLLSRSHSAEERNNVRQLLAAAK